jgi:dipeptidyl aminopeptidase/acylaminoacyl peptidase
MRLFIILALVILTGCQNRVGADLKTAMPVADSLELSRLADIQSQAKILSNDYVNVSKRTVDGITYEAHRYQTPDGRTGYKVYMEKKDKENTYTKVLIYGPEAGQSEDWTAIPNERLNKALGL